MKSNPMLKIKPFLHFLFLDKRQSLVETAIAFLIFIPILVYSLFVMDCIHLKRLSSQAVIESGRSIITSKDPLNDSEIISKELIKNQQFFFKAVFKGVEITPISLPGLSWHNEALKVKVVYVIEAPFLGNKKIFGMLSKQSISSEIIINKWNNAVILNIK